MSYALNAVAADLNGKFICAGPKTEGDKKACAVKMIGEATNGRLSP